VGDWICGGYAGHWICGGLFSGNTPMTHIAGHWICGGLFSGLSEIPMIAHSHVSVTPHACIYPLCGRRPSGLSDIPLIAHVEAFEHADYPQFLKSICVATQYQTFAPSECIVSQRCEA
jgi:hypothetical protein